MNQKIIIFLVFFSIIIHLNAFDFIETYGNYYNVTKVNNFLDFSKTKPKNYSDIQYSYYSDICSNSSILINNSSGVFESNLFGLPNIPSGSSVLIKNGTIVQTTTYLLDIEYLCVGGTLNIDVKSVLNVWGIIVLKGATVQIINSDLAISKKYTNINDPFNFFPGILNLGGKLLIDGGESNFRTVTAVWKDGNTLELMSQITNPLYAIIFSESNVLGQNLFNSFVINNNILTFTGTPIPSTQKKILVVFYNFLFPKFPIFISGGSSFSIKNTIINTPGRTTNDAYNDTTIETSPNDPSKATNINIGTNQRFRGALTLQFVENSVIDKCLFLSSTSNRAPIIAFASSLNITNSIISSKSGSNIIAQYGTELIYSQNNYYFLQQADSSPSQTPPPENMDYGYEGNGIYSLSPNIISINDTFIGQNNAIHFNFISNRSSITGLDQDCYLPCNSLSNAVSNSIQYPVEFKINNPTFIQNNSLPSTNKQYLIRINNNGNQPSRTFTIKDLELSTSTSIYANLIDSTLLLDNINTLDDFSIDGTITQLQINNSNIYSSNNNNAQILSTSIQNTLIHGNPKDFNIPINQIYGSISTPYFYSNSSTFNNIKIQSIYPSTPYQMNINTVLNIVVNFETQLDIKTLQCILLYSLNGESSEINKNTPTKTQCQFEFLPENEGSYNLSIIIRSEDNDYLVLYPNVVAFPNYRFYSGLFFKQIESKSQVDIQHNTFISGCVKPYCVIDGSNTKYSTLPNTLDNNPFKEIVQYGITTNQESQPLEIEFTLDPTSAQYQIQLYFVYYQAVDSYGSPLSISINGEPIVLLKTIYQESVLNNITFFYKNHQNLPNAKLSIENRGDIYLTSIIVYSNTDPLIKGPIPKDYKYLIKIIIPIVVVIIALAIILFIIKRKYNWPNRAYFSFMYYKHYGFKKPEPIEEPIFNPEDYDKYQVHSWIFSSLQDSKYHLPSSETFPIKFSSYKLDFNLKGGNSPVGKYVYDRLRFTNKTNETINFQILTPPNNGGISCFLSETKGMLGPGESRIIIISIHIQCSLKYLEKIAFFIEGIGHTFICLDLETYLSPILDISEFEFNGILGEGAYGVVYEAKWRDRETAVKIIKINQPEINKREIEILSDTKHANIITYLGVISNFHSLGIVTEYAKYGSLHSVLYNPDIKLSIIQKLNIALDIAKGCCFLHECGIIHRDIKPGNILVVNIADSGVCAKVSDFGGSREIGFNSHSTLTHNIGTPMYMSNEALLGDKYTYSSDVFSFGILLYELMTGYRPYMGLSMKIEQFVEKGGRPKMGFEYLPKNIQVLISKCWHQNPRKRPKFKSVVKRLNSMYQNLISEREHLMDRIKEREEEREKGIDVNVIQMDEFEANNKFLKINIQDNKPKKKKDDEIQRLLEEYRAQLKPKKKQLPKPPPEKKRIFIVSDEYQNIYQKADYTQSDEKFRPSIKFERPSMKDYSLRIGEFEKLMRYSFYKGIDRIESPYFKTDIKLLNKINPILSDILVDKNINLDIYNILTNSNTNLNSNSNSNAKASTNTDPNSNQDPNKIIVFDENIKINNEIIIKYDILQGISSTNDQSSSNNNNNKNKNKKIVQ